MRPRRGATGALLLEISGEEREKKADLLASRLRGVLGTREGVRVSRPSRQAEFRLTGLEESLTRDEVAAAVAKASNGVMGDVTVGPLRRAPGGLITVWVRCPLRVANAVLGKGRVVVGWVSARVEPLETRPLQCFKCHERGHVRAVCTSLVDRSNACYRCGADDHRARKCTASQALCALCAESGRPSNHRMGGPACNPPKKRGGVGGGPRGVNTTITSLGSPANREKGGVGSRVEVVHPWRWRERKLLPPKTRRGSQVPSMRRGPRRKEEWLLGGISQ